MKPMEACPFSASLSAWQWRILPASISGRWMSHGQSGIDATRSNPFLQLYLYRKWTVLSQSVRIKCQLRKSVFPPYSSSRIRHLGPLRAQSDIHQHSTWRILGLQQARVRDGAWTVLWILGGLSVLGFRGAGHATQVHHDFPRQERS